MRFDILTLFPEFFVSPLETSLIAKALKKNLFSVKAHNIRDWSHDRHRRADDLAYGGGPGMVMKPEPIAAAIGEIQKKNSRRIYFTPQGKTLKQADLKKYLSYDQLILLCGRYEGVDQRVLDSSVDEEVSIGDYVLSGGEAAAWVFVEALTRLIPGVLGKESSLDEESFSVREVGQSPLLEYPQYTRPEVFEGKRVPPVLLSGNHKKIVEWRREKSLEKTKANRPDLLKK